MSIEKYKRDNGDVAVLYSPGFGAGWSTWASEYVEFLMFDKGLVELAMRNADEDEVDEYIKSKIGDEYVFLGGWRDITIGWAQKGDRFEISEYDGSESIEYLTPDRGYTV